MKRRRCRNSVGILVFIKSVAFANEEETRGKESEMVTY